MIISMGECESFPRTLTLGSWILPVPEELINGAIWTDRDSQGLQNHTQGKVCPNLTPIPILPYFFFI
uniref:Uncharacterized protein n=1 Tax=Daphnia galeata TaxID=27404 RepID=A0A8J2RG50_9CRUS|nr:unnamed protein product [Daphnia galeata]